MAENDHFVALSECHFMNPQTLEELNYYPGMPRWWDSVNGVMRAWADRDLTAEDAEWPAPVAEELIKHMDIAEVDVCFCLREGMMDVSGQTAPLSTNGTPPSPPCTEAPGPPSATSSQGGAEGDPVEDDAPVSVNPRATARALEAGGVGVRAGESSGGGPELASDPLSPAAAFCAAAGWGAPRPRRFKRPVSGHTNPSRGSPATSSSERGQRHWSPRRPQTRQGPVPCAPHRCRSQCALPPARSTRRTSSHRHGCQLEGCHPSGGVPERSG